jgi:L-histidine Nalpha-methyltransferase
MSSRSALRAPRPTETANEFAADVIAGLTAKPKYLPPKYFYDLTGSGLFDRITELPEYYPTRSELGLLEKHAPEIAAIFRICRSFRSRRISPR